MDVGRDSACQSVVLHLLSCSNTRLTQIEIVTAVASLAQAEEDLELDGHLSEKW